MDVGMMCEECVHMRLQEIGPVDLHRGILETGRGVGDIATKSRVSQSYVRCKEKV